MAINQYDVPQGQTLPQNVTSTIGSSNAQYTAGMVEVLVDSTYSKRHVIAGLQAVIDAITIGPWPS